MIEDCYLSLQVTVTDLGNGAYRLADAALVDTRNCRGVRLPAEAADFVRDVMAFGRASGLVFGSVWVVALAEALAMGLRVSIVLG